MIKFIYDFQQFKGIQSFNENIISGKIAISETDEDQTNVLKNIVVFNNKCRPRTKEDKMKKRNTCHQVNVCCKGRALILNA